MNLENKIALVTGAGRGMGRSISLALAAEGANVAVSDINATEVEDTSIAVRESGPQSLAVHAPDIANGTVLAFMHGGGWTNGYKEWMAFMAPAFNDAGVILVSIGYRLAPKHIYPTAFHDATRAVAWLHVALVVTSPIDASEDQVEPPFVESSKAKKSPEGSSPPSRWP